MFLLGRGSKINIQKSKIMGIGTSQEEVDVASNVIGCNTFSSPFNYLGVKVGSSSSRSNFWDEMESIRRRFFNGADINENKMSMIGWEKIMVSRKKGGLDDHLLLAVGAPTRWVSEVPIKINIMAWKVSLDKLPTRLNLSLRVIMESLVKKKQKGAILELKRRHLKNTIFCTYTPYPAMKIRRISASSAQETRNDQFPIRLDEPNRLLLEASYDCANELPKGLDVKSKPPNAGVFLNTDDQPKGDNEAAPNAILEAAPGCWIVVIKWVSYHPFGISNFGLKNVMSNKPNLNVS
ncbi:hypothetical protein Tco_1554108 [Tanacetum coccineum]